MRRDNILPFRRRPHRARRPGRGFSAIDALAIVATLALVAFSFAHDTPAPDRPGRDTTVTVLRGGDAWGGVSRTDPASPRLGSQVSGSGIRVRDGDTIEVSGVPVRLAALDCAESGTRAGNRATARLRTLLRNETVTCRLTGERSYDRWIGSCHLASGRDIADRMIAEGYCTRWR